MAGMTRRPWDLVMQLDRQERVPPFLQIARALVADIQRGRLHAGDRLPGSRRLASTLRVHRNTVLAALDELVAQGWIETAAGQGTFVARALPDDRSLPLSRRLASRSRMPTTAPFALENPPPAYRPPTLPPGTLNLSNGAPDVRLVPTSPLGRAYRRVLARQANDVLAYGEPEGHSGLRAAVASMLASTRGLTTTADDILVTRGSQMALALIARALCRRGDVVAVEDSGYRPAWEAFRAAGATLLPVPVDRDGLEVETLARLAQGQCLRAVYVTPHHQYPTTVTLKAARRIALLELARARGVAIIEDDYDHEFHYDGRPVLPLASANVAGRVVYVGTLSKVLAPGLRIGYVAAPAAVVGAVAAVRSLVDIQGDRALEAALASFIEDGELQRHIGRARRVYAARREILTSCLRRTFSDDVAFATPSGGMALWVRFRVRTNLDAFARRSAEHGVFWYPGRRYAFDGRPQPFARFSFAALDERELPEAVRRLGAAYRAVMRASRREP